MHTIKFDEHSGFWRKDLDTNLYFVKHQCEYLMEKCKAIGYIYLNDIYQSFGVAWNPNWDNTCYLCNEDSTLEFEITYIPEKSVDIVIEIHDLKNRDLA